MTDELKAAHSFIERCLSMAVKKELEGESAGAEKFLAMALKREADYGHPVPHHIG